MKLKFASKQFLTWYKKAEEAEKKKKEYRQMFFDSIEFKPSELARQSVFVPLGEDPMKWAAIWYPRWRVVAGGRVLDEWKIVIEEDPKYKSFTFIHPTSHKVYQRTVAESSPQVDLNELKEKNPLLYEKVTQYPVVEKILKPLNSLDPEDLAKLVKYLQPPKLTLRMEKPRDAKPEELE